MSTHIMVEIFLADFLPGEGVLVERAAALAEDEDPTDTAIRLVDARRYDSPRFLHSTSWRYEEGVLFLTYLALLPAERLTGPLRVPIAMLVPETVGSAADPRPPEIDRIDTLAHALRHLAEQVERGASTFAGLSPYALEVLAKIIAHDRLTNASIWTSVSEAVAAVS